MLRFIPPTPDILHLLDRFSAGYLSSGVIQTWANGSAMFVHCNQCGQPAVLITEYIGGRGLHCRIQCLASLTHGRPLNPNELAFVGDCQRADAAREPLPQPLTLPFYSPIPAM